MTNDKILDIILDISYTIWFFSSQESRNLDEKIKTQLISSRTEMKIIKVFQSLCVYHTITLLLPIQEVSYYISVFTRDNHSANIATTVNTVRAGGKSQAEWSTCHTNCPCNYKANILFCFISAFQNSQKRVS